MTKNVRIMQMGVEAEKPEFDFSRVSHKQGREISRTQLKIQHLAKRIDQAGVDDDIDTLLDEFDALIDRQEAYILTTVVSVPRSWLVVDAPADIKWREHGSLQWLGGNKFKALAVAMGEAQNPN